MSPTARQFTIRRRWCDWQYEIENLTPRQERDLLDQYFRLRLDAAFLIGFMA